MNLIIDYRWLGIMPTARTTEEPAAKAKKPKKRAAGQREMLLPIASKGTAKEAAKEKAKEPARLQLVSGKLANLNQPRLARPSMLREAHPIRGTCSSFPVDRRLTLREPTLLRGLDGQEFAVLTVLPFRKNR
jgi:hypothetical protein